MVLLVYSPLNVDEVVAMTRIDEIKPSEKPRFPPPTDDDIREAQPNKNRENQEQAVDDAAEDSFPASDPPPWSPTSTRGVDPS